MGSGQIAKVIILSSVTTTLLLGGALYSWRGELLSYLETHIDRKTVTVERSASQPVEQNAIVSAIASANPAVVSVIVTKDVPVYERYYESLQPWSLFDQFAIPRVRENGTREQEIGGGSGFIVSSDGMIVTNRHVVADTEARYSILLNDGTQYRVDVAARDPQLDIAILQISDMLEAALPYVSFGDSESLQLGESVIAIGNALAEFRNSVSVGVVSGLARSVVASDGMGRSEQLDQVIQTDAAINPGNSGGPLLNSDGEVVGVNVATSRGADNIGFALPAHVVKEVVDSVREHGEIVRPFLGVRYVMITDQISERNTLPVDFGALVIRGELQGEFAVLPGSPADKAGITEHMIILAIDGEELRDRDLAKILRTKEVGQEITVRVFEDGREKVLSIVLEKAL